jgi:hypothetical protein
MRIQSRVMTTEPQVIVGGAYSSGVQAAEAVPQSL